MALAVTLLAGLFFLVGAVFAWRARGFHAIEQYALSLAFGALVCVAMLDLAPEVGEAIEVLGAPLALALVALGAVVLVLLDAALPSHRSHHGARDVHTGESPSSHSHSDSVEHQGHGTAHIGAMAVLAISAHNLAEGAAIYTVAMQDLAAGFLFAIGVGLHNAPLGMLYYSTMGDANPRTVGMLAVATLSTFAGGLLLFALGGIATESLMLGVVCVALGMVGYILIAELLPAMHRMHNPLRCIRGVAIGAALVSLGIILAG